MGLLGFPFRTITLVFFGHWYRNIIHRLLMEGGCMGLLLGSICPMSRSLLLYIDSFVAFAFPDLPYSNFINGLLRKGDAWD
jgi:hypothetical protein